MNEVRELIVGIVCEAISQTCLVKEATVISKVHLVEFETFGLSLAHLVLNCNHQKDIHCFSIYYKEVELENLCCPASVRMHNLIIRISHLCPKCLGYMARKWELENGNNTGNIFQLHPLVVPDFVDALWPGGNFPKVNCSSSGQLSH